MTSPLGSLDIRRRSPQRTERLTIPISLGGHTFEFHLCTRPVELGPSVTVQYYWMDITGIRSLNSDAAETNFRSCIGHWRQAMRVNHVMDDPAEQEHYVIAACYPLVCRNKSTQSIYIDAVLDRIGSYRLDVTLPDEARARIREIIQSRDRDRVGLELDATLARFEPPTQERPQLQVTFEHWLNKGVAALRQGDDDFVGFLKEFDRWMVRSRNAARTIQRERS